MKIITLYHNFGNEGGAQNIALFLARNINKESKHIVLYNSKKITANYACSDLLYKPMNIINIFKYRKDYIFLSHSRLYTTILFVVGLFIKIRVIAVAHNTLMQKSKWRTIFPNRIIAVSNGVKTRLVNCFGVDSNRINVIFNGLIDSYNPIKELDNDPNIKILLAARVCNVKQQVEIVKQLKGKLPTHIRFYFAGDGEDILQLKELTEMDPQFKVLGHIDLAKEIYKYDYIALFSKYEGLGLSLIEGCMHRKPLLTNAIEAVLDVNHQGFNGFVYNSWSDIIDGLRTLPHRDDDKYIQLANNSRKVFENNFMAETMIERYKTVIRSEFSLD